MPIRHVLKLTAFTCLAGACLAGTFTGAPARAQDDRDTYVRMYTDDNKLIAPPPVDSVVPAHHSVGNVPSATRDAAPQSAAPASSTPVPTRANAVPPPPGQHRAVTMSNMSGGSLAKVESFGTLTDAKSGSLGADMWDGSNRDTVATLIQTLPNASTFRIANQLTRRVLLTQADTNLLNGDAPAPGRDLSTLRIRKLMDMGALDDAAALYKENPLPPHDASMAEAGIEALLADAQPALACLETKALDRRFSGDAGWAPLNTFCNYLIGQMSGRGATTGGGGDGAVRQIAGSATYRFHAGDLHDLDRQPALDRIMLAADHRIDYRGLSGAANLSPLTLALIVHDASAPITLRFNLLIAGARTGIFDKDDIANFYKSIPFGSLAQTEGQLSGGGRVAGWQRVAWLYKSGDSQHGLIDKAVLQAALPLRAAYGDIALWPFASLLQTVDPAGLGAETVRSGVAIALQADQTIPPNWAAAWRNAGFGHAGNTASNIAFAIGTNNSINESVLQNSDLSKSSTDLLSIIVDELDKGKKLHNINQDEVQSTGTSDPDVAGLASAENGNRLGEATLLASAALDRQTPATLSPAVFREVLRGYRLIGLNKEARALAIEVALGLK